MISKEIIDSVRPRIYSNALRITGDNPLFDRDSFVIDSVAELWWALIDRVELLDSPSPISAESFLYLLQQYMPELEITQTDSLYFEVKTANWAYKVRGGITGFEICPEYRFILAERADKMIRFGINPNVKNPERFLARLFMAFDESVPEMLNVIREEEYRAMSDYKEHQVRKTILRNILKPLPVKPSFFIAGDKTKCEMDIDGWTLSFCVSSSEMEELAKTLFAEMQEIIHNPKAALRFGDRYSLE